MSSTTYNADGSVATETLPSGGGLAAETITKSYDTSGFIISAVGLDAYISSTSYYPWGTQYQTVSGPAGKQVRATTTMDEATGRLTDSTIDTQNQTIPTNWDERRTDTYRYDNAGNVTAVLEKASGAVVSAQCFTYDRLTRLTDAWTNTTGACAAPTTPTGGPDPYRSNWTYDTAGNRTGQTSYGIGGASNTVTAYTYPAAGGSQPHALASAVTTGSGAGTNTYGYDLTGETTARSLAGVGQTLTWDAEGHLSSQTISGQTTSYLYGSDGARLLRRDPDGSTTAYLGNEELKKSPLGTLTATRYYGAAASRTPAGLTWLGSDHHGSAQIAIDATTLTATTRRFAPFGEARGTPPAWVNGQGFVGGTQDPTGLIHLGAREYDSSIGRFISVDPLQDLTDPQQWNGFAYANNNPVTFSDPSGLIAMAPAESGCYPTCEYTLPNGTQVVTDKTKKDDNGKNLVCFDKVCPSSKSVKDIYKLADLYDANRVKNPNFNHAHPTDVQIGITLLGSCIEAQETRLCSWDYIVALYDYTGKIEINKYNRDHPADGATDAILFGLLTAMQMVDGFSPSCGRVPELKGNTRNDSFAGDTKVVMADGTTKPIKDIKIGDRVLATDPETGRSAAEAVTRVVLHQDKLAELDVNGQSIKVTEYHLFWDVTDNAWEEAQVLDPGDRLLSTSGTAEVDGFQSTSGGVEPAYNLTVVDIHTYYVVAGTTPVLVHNDGDSFYVPDDYVIVLGGGADPMSRGEVFSGTMGSTAEEAAAAVPHGSIYQTTAGQIRAAGGTVEYAPEKATDGRINYNHVNISLGNENVFGANETNPVAKPNRMTDEALRRHDGGGGCG